MYRLHCPMFLIGTLLLKYYYFTDGFATWMTKDFCDRSLIEGEIIMNNAAIYSEERLIKVMRGEVDLQNNSKYIPSESLIVSLDVTDGQSQFVLEVTNGIFSGMGSGCNGKRFSSTSKKAVLSLPSADSTDATLFISIRAGWAMGHGEVKLTPPFVLHPSITEVDRSLKAIPVHPPKKIKNKNKNKESNDNNNHTEDNILKEGKNEKKGKSKLKSKSKRRKMIPIDHQNEEAIPIDLNLVQTDKPSEDSISDSKKFEGERAHSHDIAEKLGSISNLRGKGMDKYVPTWASTIVIFLLIFAIVGILSALRRSKLFMNLFSKNNKTNE